MNGWTWTAAVVLGCGLAGALWGVTTGPLARRVAAQNLATAAICPGLLLLAQGYDRPSYIDLALVLAVLGPVGTLVFARLLADELTAAAPAAEYAGRCLAALGGGVVLAVCAAADPGRETLKILVTGALLIGGNLVVSRALSGGLREVPRG
ncbi:monovalent cation/H+ antiporter complex subunit F [Streptomyces sp. NPDC093094]|uniref:monovalent cation/H+ antiporter complex subunit F n=1 Tax=Streptomyces sp. NPDC093094 TaxID=3366026 RepID=UPI003828C40F